MAGRRNTADLRVKKIGTQKITWGWQLFVAFGPHIDGAKAFNSATKAERAAERWAKRFGLKIAERKVFLGDGF